MQNFEDFARSAAGRVLDAILPVPAERLAEALTLDVVLELENHIADGKADEVADWAVRGCSEGLGIAADWLGRPESVRWEGRRARSGGLGRFGVRLISGRGSVPREETPSECLNPEGCDWPYESGTRMPPCDDKEAPWTR